MPWVDVYAKDGVLTDADKLLLRVHLQINIAKAATIPDDPDWQLTPTDVEVKFHKPDLHDALNEFELVVWPKVSDHHKHNLDRLADAAVRAVEVALSGKMTMPYFVYPELVRAKFRPSKVGIKT